MDSQNMNGHIGRNTIQEELIPQEFEILLLNGCCILKIAITRMKKILKA